MRCCSESGQATVEAALALPVLCAVLGLMLQPAILLYDKAVMMQVASDSCRVLATQASSDSSIKSYVLHGLGRIPSAGVFHAGGSEGWDVTLSKSGASVQVDIAHRVDPLPLFGMTAGLVADASSGRQVEQKVQAHSAVVPTWAGSAGSPEGWVRAWK